MRSHHSLGFLWNGSLYSYLYRVEVISLIRTFTPNAFEVRLLMKIRHSSRVIHRHSLCSKSLLGKIEQVSGEDFSRWALDRALPRVIGTTMYYMVPLASPLAKIRTTRLLKWKMFSFDASQSRVEVFPLQNVWHARCLAFYFRVLQANAPLYNSCIDFAIAEANRIFPPPCRFSWSASSPTRWFVVSVTLDPILHV